MDLVTSGWEKNIKNTSPTKITGSEKNESMFDNIFAIDTGFP